MPSQATRGGFFEAQLSSVGMLLIARRDRGGFLKTALFRAGCLLFVGHDRMPFGSFTELEHADPGKGGFMARQG